MDQEIWKDIEDYNGLYQISSFGRVKSTRYNRYLKLIFNKKGYARIHLNKKGKLKSFRVHRLVASAFIPNPDNKPQVNHKDGNKTNNCIDNLEWVTNEENYCHAIRNNLVQRNRRKCALLFNGKEIKRFGSIRQAQLETNGKYGNVEYRIKINNKITTKKYLKDYKWVLL